MSETNRSRPAIVFLAALTFSVAGGSGRAAAPPAAAPDPRVDELQRRVEQLERTVAEQQETIRKLLARSSPALQPGSPPAQPSVAPAPPGTSSAQASETPGAKPPSALEQQLEKELGAAWGKPDAAPAQSTAAQAAPGPVPLVGSPSGGSYINLSLDALMAGGASTVRDIGTLQSGGHDPSQRGFSVQNVEMVLDGAVDPYFRGQANVVLQVTPEGETTVELEEAYATTSSLPHNFQVKAGQFLTDFGRINPSHPHTWDFVDQPLVNGRMFGGDGLRSVGAQLSWLAPFSFYSELLLTVQNAHGATLTSFGAVAGDEVFGRPIVDRPVASLGDMLYTGRYAGSVDLTPEQTLLFGASAAAGPNGTGDGARTHIYGLDLFWKWKAANADRGFPFVKVQTEGMKRNYEAAATDSLAAVTFKDWGAYGQLAWGFRPGWILAGRYDRVGGDLGDLAFDPQHEGRWRASANVTWFPTEFSKLRLQYNHDHRQFAENADSVWLQFEFLLGAHAAHKF